jgi:hypothetical protein
VLLSWIPGKIRCTNSIALSAERRSSIEQYIYGIAKLGATPTGNGAIAGPLLQPRDESLLLARTPKKSLAKAMMSIGSVDIEIARHAL